MISTTAETQYNSKGGIYGRSLVVLSVECRSVDGIHSTPPLGVVFLPLPSRASPWQPLVFVSAASVSSPGFRERLMAYPGESYNMSNYGSKTYTPEQTKEQWREACTVRTDLSVYRTVFPKTDWFHSMKENWPRTTSSLQERWVQHVQETQLPCKTVPQTIISTRQSR